MEESLGDELFRHIKKNLLKGYKEESIRWAMVNQGYSRSAVDRALRKAVKSIEEEKSAREEEKKKAEKPKITYSVYDENNKIIYPKKSFWKRLFGKN